MFRSGSARARPSGLQRSLVYRRPLGPLPPSGPTFSFWQPEAPAGLTTPSGLTYELAIRLVATASGELRAVWYHSPPGAIVLPSNVTLWNVATESALVPYTPSWSGAPGSGWVRAPLPTPAILAAGSEYSVSVWGTGGNWYAYTINYWPTDALMAGPLTIPAGERSWVGGSGGPPTEFPAEANGANFWIDVEVA